MKCGGRYGCGGNHAKADAAKSCQQSRMARQQRAETPALERWDRPWREASTLHETRGDNLYSNQPEHISGSLRAAAASMMDERTRQDVQMFAELLMEHGDDAEAAWHQFEMNSEHWDGEQDIADRWRQRFDALLPIARAQTAAIHGTTNPTATRPTAGRSTQSRFD